MTQDQTTPTSMYCRKCGYQLSNESGNYCPDCGSPFDRQDHRTFRRRLLAIEVRLWLRRLGKLAVPVVLLILIPWIPRNLLGWVLVSLGAAAAGAHLMIRSHRRRADGHEPHCLKCDYNLTGLASAVCPECGTVRAPANTTYGEPRRRSWMMAAGICLMLMASLPIAHVFRNWPPAPRPAIPTGPLRDISKRTIDLISRLKRDLQEAEAITKSWAVTTKRPDVRMQMLTLHVQDKMKQSIARYVGNPGVKAAALAELQAADQLLTLKILPAYRAAIVSKKPADARAVVPLLDELERHMDKLMQILKGY